jgi:hypothetical protein
LKGVRSGWQYSSGSFSQAVKSSSGNNSGSRNRSSKAVGAAREYTRADWTFKSAFRPWIQKEVLPSRSDVLALLTRSP